MIRKFWLYVPLVHSEDIDDHRAVALMFEETRLEVERYSGERDPWRDTEAEDLKDTALFSKLMPGGPPRSSPEFFFWFLRVACAHLPIIA